MAQCTFNFHSPTLQKAMTMVALLPDEADRPGPYPVWYVLHGLSDDCTIWSRRTRIEEHVRCLPLIVVMPDGDRSWYTDAKEGAPWETYLVRDVVGFVDRHFQTIARREGRAISGNSMGGYGALKAALKHQDQFSAAVCQSGAIRPYRLEGIERARVFGNRPAGGPEDLFALTENARRDMLPAIRIDCGTGDTFIDVNRELHSHLARLGIPHEYAEFEGEHNWQYWEDRLPETVQFVARALQLGR